MNNLNDILGKITEFFKTEAKTETVIGQQFKLGEYSCIPVMSIGLGFGGGNGEGKGNAKGQAEGEGNGAGAGGGIGMAPIGFLVTKGNEIQFIPVRSSKGLASTFEKLPDLLEKLLDKNKKRETEKV